MIALTLLVSPYLLALPAQAGTWSFAATSWSYTHTLNGDTYGTLKPRSYGSEIFAAGGQDNASTTAEASENLTVTATYNPDPNVVGDTAPLSTVVKIQSSACSDGIVNHVTTPGRDADDGFSDPIDSTGTSQGTHYWVEAGNTFQVTLKLFVSYTNPSGVAEAVVGGISFSIVSGGWAGPYYFHYGNNFGGSQQGPWAGNTASPTPSITDTPDTTTLFPNSTTMDNQCEVQGSITPVWYWTGPDLGVPPPAFTINVTTTAFARDYNEVADEELDALDGQDDTPQSAPPNSNETSDTDEKSVKVQSDEYVPGQGNGYWAVGPTIDMDAGAGNPSEQAPFNLYSSIILTAAIEGPGNG